MTGAWIAAWWSVALAQDSVQNYDPMVLTTVQPLSGATAADAERAFQLLDERFRRTTPVIGMTEVPRFEAQGYGADEYLRVCPPDQYAGCALVVAQRTDATWAVGATVAPGPAAADPAAPAPLSVTVFFIDVLSAEIVARFEIALGTEQDAAIIDGIAAAYDEMVQGAYDQRDLRDTEDPAAREARRKAQAAAVAASLAVLERQLGDVVRGDVVGNITPPKVTRAELDALDTREEVAPWERVGMSKGEYRRYANSGDSLLVWRREANGRFGQLIARVAAGGGTGATSQRYESLVLLDATLEPIHLVQLNEVARGGTGAFDLELGLGVAPWVEITGALGFRTGKLTTLVDDDVEGQAAIPGSPSTQALNTRQLGVRAAFVPGNHWPVRPMIGAGLALWRGVSVQGTERQPAMARPTALLFEVLPGVEVQASPRVNLFARGVIGLPVGGTGGSFEETGAGLPDPPQPASAVARGGVAAQAGVTLRVGPVWTIDDRTTSAIRVDDEPPE